MTEKECLAAGIAVSLFAHFALLIAPRPPEPEPSFTTVVQMDMASPAVATSREKGIGIAAASPRDMDKADAADRKRQAFLRYLDDIDEAVHARRLDGGETGLIGVHRPARRDVHRSRAPRILRLAAARRLGAPGRPRRQRQSAPPRHHRNGTHPRHSARQIPIRPPLIAPPPGNPAGSHGEGRVGLTV